MNYFMNRSILRALAMALWAAASQQERRGEA